MHIAQFCSFNKLNTESNLGEATEFVVYRHCMPAWIYRFSQKVSDFKFIPVAI